MRKSYSRNFKAKVAVEIIREKETIAQISSRFGVHRTLLTKWKKEAIEGLPEIFSKKSNKKNTDKQLIGDLYKQIGQLKVENDWLKKKVETINL